jgi:rubrerythrin
MDINAEQLKELFYQAMATEKAGVLVYEAALKASVHPDLKNELEKYADQTRNHVTIMNKLFETFGLDPNKKTPGFEIVETKGQALVQAIEKALAWGDPKTAQIVAAECVVDIETKDHMNWELLAEASRRLMGEKGKALKDAVDEVEEQEDQHLYHLKGWTRELWIESLGMEAVLPPPEERKNVDTAIAAERAKMSRNRMLQRGGRRRGARKEKEEA